MVIKEYRICLPMSIEEYRIGQLYMIAKHSFEQSDKGEGVEVVVNEPCNHAEFGSGQYTEKRIHLSSKLPKWIQNILPRIFYITEKAWNYYPYTETVYSCSFIPRCIVTIKTKFKSDNGQTSNVFSLSSDQLGCEVDFVDIVTDPYPEKHYRASEDLKIFHSEKTSRGPLSENWLTYHQPIMCSYKLVDVKFEIWGLQDKVENFVHSAIRDVLLVAHRQAFAWIDEWYEMTIDDVRLYEKNMHEMTNQKVL